MQRTPQTLGLLSLLLGSLISACASTATRNVPPHHILQFDRQGTALDPSRKDLRPLDKADDKGYDRYLESMFSELAQQQPGTERKLLIFIHGGLNNVDDTIDRAVNFTAPITQAGYYPIYIGWDSSLKSSYVMHLVRLRQGESSANWWAAPLLFIGDGLRAISKLPLVWFSMIKSDAEGARLGQSDLQEFANKTYCTYRQRYETDPDSWPAISKGGNRKASEGASAERVRADATYALTLPTKLISAPLIDAAGTASWEVMLRNTRLLFQRDSEYDKRRLESPDHDIIESRGGLQIFLKKLEEKMEEAPDVHWDITLIGHSMGAIVLNGILRNTSIDFETIVYMAAASSIEDYEGSVFPYMAAHPCTHVYHLLLHDVSEASDRSAGPLFPQGSLLVWIDNFLSSPITLRQRTAGRFVNLLYALPDTPEELLPRISIKIFSNDSTKAGDDPQRHGDFASTGKKGMPKYRFYGAEFWTPDPPSTPDQCCNRPVDNPDPNCR